MLSISSRVLMKTRPVQDKRKTETRLMAYRGPVAGLQPALALGLTLLSHPPLNHLNPARPGPQSSVPNHHLAALQTARLLPHAARDLFRRPASTSTPARFFSPLSRPFASVRPTARFRPPPPYPTTLDALTSRTQIVPPKHTMASPASAVPVDIVSPQAKRPSATSAPSSAPPSRPPSPGGKSVGLS